MVESISATSLLKVATSAWKCASCIEVQPDNAQASGIAASAS